MKYEPSASENTGQREFGIIIFMSLSLVAAGGAFILKFENSTNKAFFATIFLVGVCEQRYWSMALSGDLHKHRSVWMHLISSIFFFLSFSLVAYQWAGILAGSFHVRERGIG